MNDSEKGNEKEKINDYNDYNARNAISRSFINR